MSHEIRTPLNSIIGFSDIMLQGITGEITPKQQSCVTNISISGNHLLRLINNLLDLSKIEAGKMELHPEPCDLKKEVSTVEASISSLLDKKKHVMEKEFEEELPDLYADIGVVRQILLNLLSNAHKFTPKEGRIVVSAKVSRDQPGFVEVSVADTGQGIPEEDLPHVFDEFMQVGTMATRGEKGTGLGLALCKKFIQLHGGSIWAESEVGKGSRFCFTLPLAKSETAPSASQD
jgi:signal transduction histidine kinase